MTTASALTANTAVLNERARRRINLTLNGPVMEVLAELVPDLAVFPRDRRLEMALSDCALLHRCFNAFRGERKRFRTLLVDRRDRPVENDNAPLACGRTVNQVISMIVRSAAKRHFRMRLDRRAPWPDGVKSRPRLQKPVEVGWGGMLRWMTGRAEESRQVAMRPVTSSGDQLYDAIRKYLLHDWQVPIIPQYARMTPPEVWSLGARILDFRDADELAAYLDRGANSNSVPERWAVEAVETSVPPLVEVEPMPPPPAPVVGGASLPSAPLVADGRARLGEVLSQDGRTLRMEAFVPILLRPETKAMLGWPSQTELLRASRVMAGTGAGTVRRLAVDFGLSVDQMGLMLASAALALPQPVFEKVFGRHGDAMLILALIQKARMGGLGPDSDPADFAAFMRDLFSRFGR
ncbi:hypothetical protein CU669_09195 [Paramagnetospirillum kuznetsovii]|uniref:Uncharacterized protein n=1 Tax=Paramagnetospirillum kuznetsovii TaxID=2053833 RepID=A0A364NYX9_9PROT|nr:hypothetical protein [Paramagnetospirillum kuznetsovii]RAU22288.1 hypothetical protein CU669_09195 [Paramagnetospirillum kuznetsovii]